MASDGRIEALDIAKGLCMILVIAGHAFSMRFIYPVYAFHLPCFFFISGILLKESRLIDTANFVKYETRTILKSFAVLLLISVAICVLIPEWRGMITPKGFFRDIYFANPNFAQNSSLWYLVSFWIALIYFSLLYRYFQSRRIICALMIFVIAALSILLPDAMRVLHLPGGRLPLRADTAVVALVFIAMGFLCKDVVVRYLECLSRWLCVLALLVVALAGSILNGQSNMASIVFGQQPLMYFPIAFAGIAALLSLSRTIEALPFLRDFLAWYGKHSLVIFGFQSILLRAYNLIVLKVTGENLVLYGDNPFKHQILSFILVAFVFSPLIVFSWLSLERKMAYVRD